MHKQLLIGLFAVVYIVVDVVYVLSSRGFYEARLKVIQGNNKGFPTGKSGVLIGALATYAAMAVGWAMLVARQIRRETSYLEAFGLAVVYAAIVHGVFNGTLYAMLDGWDVAAVVRDISWGLLWISTLTLLYVYALKRNS